MQGVYRDAEGDQEVKLFDLYVLHPRFKATSAAQFTLERARFLQRRSNAHLLAQFDQYLSDLLGIATSVARLRTMETLSMAEFLRRHQKMLIATVQAWPHKATDAQLRRILKNMRFVAETYGLVIRAEDEKRSIAAFAALLMSWATDDKILQEVL